MLTEDHITRNLPGVYMIKPHRYWPCTGSCIYAISEICKVNIAIFMLVLGRHFAARSVTRGRVLS